MLEEQPLMARAYDDPGGYWERAFGLAPKLAPSASQTEADTAPLRAQPGLVPLQAAPEGATAIASPASAVPSSVPASAAPLMFEHPSPSADTTSRGRHVRIEAGGPEVTDSPAPEVRGRHARADAPAPDADEAMGPEVRGRHVRRETPAPEPMPPTAEVPGPERVVPPVAAAAALGGTEEWRPSPARHDRPASSERRRFLPRLRSSH